MTLLQKWIEKDSSVPKIERKIRKLVCGKSWTNIFCRTPEDILVSYTKSNLQLRRELKSTKSPYVSSIFNEELALGLIRDTIQIYALHISAWLKDEAEPEINFLVSSDVPIGKVVFQNDFTETVTSSALMTVRKCTDDCMNCSGFYIEGITAIPELPI